MSSLDKLKGTLKEFCDVGPDDKFDSNDLMLKIATEFDNETMDLLQLVECMEPAINNKSSTKRIQAMTLISDVLKNILISLLSESELRYLCTFLKSRISSDHHVTSVVLQLFLLLIDQKNISDEIVFDILNVIYQEVNCQSLIMTERRTIYLIFSKCLEKKFAAVSKMSTQFILGFVGAFDGETDPRNLMLVFSFYPFIAENLPLGNYAEDLFEVVAAYFPINFTPPINVSDPVSSDELVVALRMCMSANESIFPYCLPYLIEKIGSDTDSFEIEALIILRACCKKSTPSGVTPHLWSLLFMFYNLITGSIRNAVTQESLECIKILSSLYEGSHVNDEIIKNSSETISSLIAECLPNMINPAHRLAKPCCKIVTSVGQGAKFFSQLVCLKTVPPLIDVYKNANEYSVRKNTLVMITELIDCAATSKLLFTDQFCQVQQDYFIIYSKITEFQDDLLLETSLKLFAENISSFKENQVASLILKVLQNSNLTKINSSIECCLSSCCDRYPEILANDIIDWIIQSIKINGNSIENSAYLWLLPSSCRHKLVLNKVLPEIWSWFEQSVGANNNNSCLNFLQITLKCFQTANDCKLLDMVYVNQEWCDVQNLVFMALRLIAWRPADLQTHLKILSSISNYFVSRTERSILENLILFLIGKIDLPSMESMKDLTKSENIQEGYVIFPLLGTVCNISCVNGMASDHMKSLTSALTNLSSFCTNSECRSLASRTLSILLNFYEPGYPINPILEDVGGFIYKNLKSDDKEIQESVLAMNFWATKGLIMRNFDDIGDFTLMLENHLLSEEYGSSASNLYQILLQDYPDLFNKSIGANVRLLYKQRYFEGRIKTMVEQFNKSTGCAHYNTQMAILYLLPCLPNTVILCYLLQVLPILLQCLSSTNSSVVKVGATCLISLIPKAPEVFTEHLTTLVPSLVINSQVTDINCRLKCLESILLVSSLPSIKILPYREEVMKGLRNVLNDKKRIVRRDAALAISSWDAIGA